MISNIFNLKSIYEDDEVILVFWQKKIFKCLFLILIFIGIVPYILSCRLALETAAWDRILIYTLFYLLA
ncbi:MAG: hypothetical protein KKE44_08030, partial [Proteobacteria bacterium]|nr:hypothetical protein [Pseudomonadota bacterium]MBU1582676.1 hypothetical protein [Pseudomonadota bacterium]